jgi:hypothetical protein
VACLVALRAAIEREQACHLVEAEAKSLADLTIRTRATSLLP